LPRICWPSKETDRPERGGLAGPVGAEDDDDLALLDLEVEAAQDLDGAVAGIEVRDLEEVAHAASLPR
jgi:hypothetical protein